MLGRRALPAGGGKGSCSGLGPSRMHMHNFYWMNLCWCGCRQPSSLVASALARPTAAPFVPAVGRATAAPRQARARCGRAAAAVAPVDVWRARRRRVARRRIGIARPHACHLATNHTTVMNQKPLCYASWQASSNVQVSLACEFKDTQRYARRRLLIGTQWRRRRGGIRIRRGASSHVPSGDDSKHTFPH